MSWFICSIKNEKEYSSLNFNNSELNDVKHIIINASSSELAIKLILLHYTKKFINTNIELEVNSHFEFLRAHYLNNQLASIRKSGIPTIIGEFFRRYFCHYSIGKSCDIFYKTNDLSIEEFMKTKNYETTLLIGNNNLKLYKKDEN